MLDGRKGGGEGPGGRKDVGTYKGEGGKDDCREGRLLEDSEGRKVESLKVRRKEKSREKTNALEERELEEAKQLSPRQAFRYNSGELVIRVEGGMKTMQVFCKPILRTGQGSLDENRIFKLPDGELEADMDGSSSCLNDSGISLEGLETIKDIQECSTRLLSKYPQASSLDELRHLTVKRQRCIKFPAI